MNRFTCLAAAAALAITAAHAQSPGSTSPPIATPDGQPSRDAPADAAGATAAGLSPTDRDFMTQAAEAGHAEIEAARVAVSKARDPQVKDFAQRLLDDHTQADQRLRQLGIDKGVMLPVTPSAEQTAQIDALRSAQPGNFDGRFVQTLGIDDHRQAVDLFRHEADHGIDPQVREFARQTLPHLQQHLQTAQNLKAALGAYAQAAGETTRTADAGPTPAMAADASATPRTTTAPRSAVPAEDRVTVGDTDLQDAMHELNASVRVIQAMRVDPDIAGVLARAKGVFILPNYGRGALGVGIQAGEGLLVQRTGERFGNPVFYKLGGLSIGAQAGASGGPMAMLLMTDKAMRDFESGKKFSISADAGLTVVAWSKRAQISGGKVQDVIVWSNTKGAYAGVSVGINDVLLDQDANRAYYGQTGLSPRQILDGSVTPSHANPVARALNG